MKITNKFPKSYFLKYNEGPVKLLPYSPGMTKLATKYKQIVENLTKDFSNIEVKIVGSTAYRISTVDVEVAVYANKADMRKVVNRLKQRFGEPVQFEPDFSRFSISREKYELDVHIYSGDEARVSKLQTEYMLAHPELIQKYKEIKEKYSYSKREYRYQKNKFLNRITRSIPES